MLQNPSKDIVTLQDIKNNWQAIVSSSEKGIALPDSWIGLANSPKEWWKELPIGEVSIIGGDDELYRDDILQFSSSFKVRITASC